LEIEERQERTSLGFSSFFLRNQRHLGIASLRFLIHRGLARAADFLVSWFAKMRGRIARTSINQDRSSS
jgi:hypothetical protein